MTQKKADNGKEGWKLYTEIFGTRYENDHRPEYQFFEFRLCPFIAFVSFLTAAYLAFTHGVKKNRQLTRALALGIGTFCFGIFRFIIYWLFRRRFIWQEFWEEATELAAILFFVVLFCNFKKQFFYLDRKK
ncbi:hypothetical protein ACFL35_06070 [Candidatus Riflebacteria bacterium]